MRAAIWSPCDPPQVEYDPVAEAAEEDLQGDVEATINATHDVDLADIVLDDESPALAYDAARRILGRIIRAALRRSSATLTDDERELVSFVRESIESELKSDLACRGSV